MDCKIEIYRFSPSDARLEEDVAKGRRDWAYSERDKVFIKKYFEVDKIHNRNIL